MKENNIMKKPKWNLVIRKAYKFRWIPILTLSRLCWKDKYDSPRVEICPRLIVQWLNWDIHLIRGSDEDWEKWLWIQIYNHGDIDKAQETWPWRTYDDNKSTWSVNVGESKTDTKDTYYQFDSHGMMVVKDDPESWRDSLGRTFMAYFAYRDCVMLDNIYRCVISKNGKVNIVRHPGHLDSSMSRDHMAYFIIACAITQERGYLIYLDKCTDFKISDKFRFTIDMWAWMKAVIGHKGWEVIYYLIAFVNMIAIIIWNSVLYAVGNFHEVSQFEYVESYKPPTGFQNRLRKLLVPAYTIHIMAWQIYVLRKSVAGWILKRMLRIIVGKHNYLVLMLLDKSISSYTLNKYKPMTAWRWGVRLDASNDRDTRIIIDKNLLKYNNIESDVLYKLFLDTKNNRPY